MTIRS
jgi:hypothetical protein